MRKVILKMHVSLDGYVRAASGDVMGWIFRKLQESTVFPCGSILLVYGRT